MTASLALALTYGVTIAVAIVGLALDAFGRRSAALYAVAAGLSASTAAGVYAGVTHSASAQIASLEVGGPASMVYGVIALVGAAAVFGGLDSLQSVESGGSIAALIAFAVAAGGATAAAADLVSLLLVLETLAICAYGLVAVAHSARSGEAAMKYFVQGAVATGLLVFGIALFVGLYAADGSYRAIAEALVVPKPFFPALAASGLVLCALIFKMGAAPFHSWAPDAYETAPIEAASFLAAGPKLAAIAAASVFVSIVSSGSLSPRMTIIVSALAVVSILVGSVAAVRQRNYRRLLGYAGVAQSGYALIAVALFAPPLAAFFGSTYAVAAAGTFLAARAFERVTPGWDGSVAGLAGVGRRSPVVSGSVALMLVSLAGIPPFLGFWGKLFVFGTGLSTAFRNAGTAPAVAWSLGIAVAAGILGSVVSLAYYGAVLRAMYFEPAPVVDESHAPVAVEDGGESAPAWGSSAGSAGVVVVALAVAVTVLGLLPLAFGSGVVFNLFAPR